MASTSASSIQKSFKYDVFLSFRGEDTRRNFVDHLYHALKQRGIITYKDDEKIEKGEKIREQLIRSIEESRFYIIVFSKNYASSSWCLDELVKIMECQNTKEQTAYPVFYDVEPTQVRNQSGAVGEAFEKLVGKGKRKRPLMEDVDLENEDDVGRWRNALNDAASLAGMELKTTFNGHEAKCIQQIVEEFSLKLHLINSSIDGKLVGMETRVQNIVLSLKTGSDNVRMIGIKGMGGGGKTTLARAVFDYISNWFEGKSFVENVRESSKGSGLKLLQKQVLQDVLSDKNIDVTSVYDGKNKMIRMMPSRKALVVLDDVDDKEQLDALAGERSWFKSGSRIIIATRDEQVLKAHRVNFIHDVILLTNEEAICLFSRYAFGREIPIQGYEDFSEKVVHYADGLPLTIKVLGSFLCDRSEREWEDTIERLKRIPLKETLEKLELSYNGLEDDQKEIFLDVVCILKGETKEKAIRMLESCWYNAHIGLRVLEQKSLITISDYDGLGFHDHIEEMGRNIVRRSHPKEPSRHSRLWIKEEIEVILVKESGTEAIRSIRLTFTDLDQTIIMKGLRNMKELRLLYIQCKLGDWKVDEVSQYLPDALRYLCLHEVKCELFEVVVDKLRQLDLSRSTLRYLDLSWSKLKTFDLGKAPHLETLELAKCYEFTELHILKECRKRKSLNLRWSKVSNLNLMMTSHLKELNLANCQSFVMLNTLKLKGSIPEVPKDLWQLESLENLTLSKVHIKHIPDSICILKHLKSLELTSCLFLEKLPEELGCLECLEKLNMSDCISLRDIPNSICRMKSLTYLDLSNCDQLEKLPEELGCLECLEKLNMSYCSSLRDIPNSICRMKSLTYLNLSNCDQLEKLPEELGCLECLEKLNMSNCISLRDIPNSICRMKSLTYLDLSNCDQLEKLPEELGCLECLEKLNMSDCISLRDIPNNICRMKSLTSLDLSWCFQLEKLPEELGCLECLEMLDMSYCSSLRDIPNSICRMKSLTYLDLSICCQFEKLPEELGCLECLEKLNMTNCSSLRDIPNSICRMKSLTYLNLSGCCLLEKLPEELGCLECLEKLNMTGCSSLRDIPNSICRMKSLTDLDLSKCSSLRDVPNSICKMKSLTYLNLYECHQLKKLPEELGHSECLKGLRILGSMEQLRSYGFTSVKKGSFDFLYQVEL